MKIGTTETGKPVKLDPNVLVDSRMLVQGASGSGKSHLLRLVAEQSKIQTVILDPEGEFVTLREKVDCVIVGKEGELPADPRAAGLLARKLMELNVSAVVDLYDLKLHERRAFVRRFLESMMGLPRSLWHPALIILDEAHKYCPEKERDAESRQAVIDLMSQGRKRGYCGIVATQRLSKLHKDASAEAMNVFIGKTVQDIDQKRAADMLGIERKDRIGLRDFKPGEFYCFGPAITPDGVTRFRTDQVKTTHPKAGHRHELRSPQPSKKIRGVLKELTDLPEQAEAEIRDMKAAKAEIVRLNRELKKKPQVAASDSQIETAAKKAVAERDRYWKRELAKLEKSAKSMQQRIGKIHQLSVLNGDAPKPVATPTKNIVRTERPAVSVATRTPVAVDGEVKIGGGSLRMIQQLVDRHPARFTESQWATMSKLKKSGGTWSTYKSRLITAGLVDRQGDLWGATEEAVDRYGDPSRAPQSPEEMITAWKERLGNGPSRMIDALLEVYPNTLTREQLGEEVEITHTGGTFGTYLSRLKSNGLVEVAGGKIAVSPALMEV